MKKMVDRIANVKKEIVKRKAKCGLPEDGHLLSNGCYKAIKIRHEYYFPNGIKFLAKDFDVQTNKLLRKEHFNQGILLVACNFDPKTEKEISREVYAKDGSLSEILYFMKNGDIGKVEIFKNGSRTEVYGRAKARKFGLISHSSVAFSG